jgi:acetyltransferase-like isoleucine patch superfamily enzyme
MLKQLLNLFKKKKKNIYTIKGDSKKIHIGKNTHIDETVILNNSKGGTIKIGNNCTILEYVIISTYGGDIEIGDNSSINPFCVLYGHGNLKIGRELRMATHSIIIPANHIYKELNTPIRLQGLEKLGVTINDNVWIGADVKILDGVKIGKNVIIAAGAVVNNNISDNLIVGGVPAKIIKNRINVK